MNAFIASVLTRSRPIYQLFGANTGVGKTVVSATLGSALRRLRPHDEVLYLKPVSTGLPDDADDLHINRYVNGIVTGCLHSFDKPLSPHLAARDFKIPGDSEICNSIATRLGSWAHTPGKGVALIETAGGVLSPGPSGSLQADLYRPLRLPVILTADSRLGGISSTISAYESLILRGYDIEAIVVFRDGYYRNHEFFEGFAHPKGIPVLTIPNPPPEPVKSSSADIDGADMEAMEQYYEKVSKAPMVEQLLDDLDAQHTKRIERLESMAEKAHKVTWYPFTQHSGITSRDLAVIDSAHDDCFQTLKPVNDAGETTAKGEDERDMSLLQPTFDGSASWWTQGLGHGNPELAMTAAYAAGRYGHVMFAGTTHEPALSLSELLLESDGNSRLQKVFFTDNGSTGMEVAVKMGLRASSARYGWSADEYGDIGILGLSGSYHGDTMGVMDCSEPSTFNKRVEWYRGRGHWLDFPKVKMVAGKWIVGVPESMRSELGEDAEFPSLSAIFNLDARKESELARRYADYVKNMLQDLVVRQGRKFGALIIEPIVLGAGGMIFSDPLFQQVLIQTVRSNPKLFSATAPSPSTPNSWSGLPIIFDEVFSGLYRLGRRTAASFLQVDADISVNSKLLTGGLMPLSTTLASNETFAAFDSPSKVDALLHGHSYTANPVGCAVAEYSVRKMLEMEEMGHWTEYVQDWRQPGQDVSRRQHAQQQGRIDPEVWSCWSQNLVHDLSFAESVESVFAIGTVLSITLRDQGGKGGYTSTAAAGLQQNLKAGDGRFNVHSRVLGNVLYLMASLTSKRDTLRELEGLLRRHLV